MDTPNRTLVLSTHPTLKLTAGIVFCLTLFGGKGFPAFGFALLVPGIPCRCLTLFRASIWSSMWICLCHCHYELCRKYNKLFSVNAHALPKF